MVESHWRSVCKAISWRVTGSIDTMIVSYLVVGHVRTAVSIGLFEVVTKTVIYYFHERVWAKIKFGRYEPVDYDI